MNCLLSQPPKISAFGRNSCTLSATYWVMCPQNSPNPNRWKLTRQTARRRKWGGGKHLMKFLCSSSRRQCSLAPSRLFILIRRHRPRSLCIIYHNLSSNNLSHNIWPLEDRKTREGTQNEVI